MNTRLSSTEMATLIKPEVQALIERYKEDGTQVTFEEYKPLFLNSYERCMLYPCMNLDCLHKICTIINKQIPSALGIPVTYESAALYLFPLLLTRIEEQMNLQAEKKEPPKPETL